MLSIRLFGRFRVFQNGELLSIGEARRIQELFGYLLIQRNRTHSRELLASLLWCDNPQAKKQLRQTLWQFQSALESRDHHFLVTEPDWIGVNLAGGDCQLDLETFESASASAQGVSGEHMSEACAEQMKRAVALYRGDLLDGLNEAWCLYERARVRDMLLTMLDKLVVYHDRHGQFELAQAYGESILRHDYAHERAHQRLMRIHHRAGNRTAALRQYEQCAAALRAELNVEPSNATRVLYQQIRADSLDDGPTETNSLPLVIEQLRNTLISVESSMQSYLTNQISST